LGDIRIKERRLNGQGRRRPKAIEENLHNVKEAKKAFMPKNHDAYKGKAFKEELLGRKEKKSTSEQAKNRWLI